MVFFLKKYGIPFSFPRRGSAADGLCCRGTAEPEEALTECACEKCANVPIGGEMVSRAEMWETCGRMHECLIAEFQTDLDALREKHAVEIARRDMRIAQLESLLHSISDVDGRDKFRNAFGVWVGSESSTLPTDTLRSDGSDGEECRDRGWALESEDGEGSLTKSAEVEDVQKDRAGVLEENPSVSGPQLPIGKNMIPDLEESCIAIDWNFLESVLDLQNFVGQELSKLREDRGAEDSSDEETSGDVLVDGNIFGLPLTPCHPHPLRRSMSSPDVVDLFQRFPDVLPRPMGRYFRRQATEAAGAVWWDSAGRRRGSAESVSTIRDGETPAAETPNLANCPCTPLIKTTRDLHTQSATTSPAVWQKRRKGSYSYAANFAKALASQGSVQEKKHRGKGEGGEVISLPVL